MSIKYGADIKPVGLSLGGRSRTGKRATAGSVPIQQATLNALGNLPAPSERVRQWSTIAGGAASKPPNLAFAISPTAQAAPLGRLPSTTGAYRGSTPLSRGTQEKLQEAGRFIGREVLGIEDQYVGNKLRSGIKSLFGSSPFGSTPESFDWAPFKQGGKVTKRR